MLEWHKGLTDFVNGVFQHTVVFSSSFGILRRLPLPKFVASVVDKCNTKFIEQSKYAGHTLGPGKLIGLNVTVANFSLKTDPAIKPTADRTAGAGDPNAEAAKAKEPTVPQAADPVEFKPNFLVLPIKLTLIEPVVGNSLANALAKLGSAAEALLTSQFDGKKNDDIHMGIPQNFFNLPKDAVMTLCEKTLSKSSLRFHIYMEE